MIETKDLEIWAGYLLDHSLGGITTDDRVMIKGERGLLAADGVLERRVIEVGAMPDVYLVPPNNDRGRVWSAAMGRRVRRNSSRRVPEWHRARYETMTKYVEVLGAEDPEQFMGLEAEQSQALAAADRPYPTCSSGKPWVITLFPTEASAELEGMDFDDYRDFIVGRFDHRSEPAARGGEEAGAVVRRGHQRSGSSPSIPTTIGSSRSSSTSRTARAVMSYGLRNFPDGEIFTCPDANSAQGEIFVDLPVNYGGNDIGGIYLRFDDGRIVEYSAETGQKHLAAIIETDDGSHRLGEVALG